MDIITQTLFSSIFEYFFNNWRCEVMIALIVGFIVFFIMNCKYKSTVLYYENLIQRIEKHLDDTHKGLDDIKKLLEKEQLINDITKRVTRSIKTNNKNRKTKK